MISYTNRISTFNPNLPDVLRAGRGALEQHPTAIQRAFGPIRVAIFCQLAKIATVSIHSPNVFAATACRYEDDISTIRSSSGLIIRGAAARQLLTIAAVCRHGPDILTATRSGCHH